MPPLESTPGQFTYMYARPALTVDAIVVAAEEEPKVLLILRKNQPFQGMWATPGGYVDDGEPLDTAVARELQEETSIDPASIKLIQIGTFGDPGRDPRGWMVGVQYAALVPTTELGVKAADDAADAKWWPIASLPLPLACDHQRVLAASFRRLALEVDTRDNLELVAKLNAAAAQLD